jgi:hypothetical protein
LPITVSAAGSNPAGIAAPDLQIVKFRSVTAGAHCRLFVLKANENAASVREAIQKTSIQERTMFSGTSRISVRKEMNSRMWGVVLCGLAGFALTLPAAPKDVTWNPGALVDVQITVGALREVPAGNPLAGLHLDAKAEGRVMDIYIAPTDFAAKYGVKVSKGEYVHIVGMQVKSGDEDVVLARAITTGSVDKRTGIFHENMTIYLRNDGGPLWL